MSILDSSSALSRFTARQGIRPAKGEIKSHITENQVRRKLLEEAKEYNFKSIFSDFTESYRSIVIEYIQTSPLNKKTFEKIFGAITLNQIIQVLK